MVLQENFAKMSVDHGLIFHVRPVGGLEIFMLGQLVASKSLCWASPQHR